MIRLRFRQISFSAAFLFKAMQPFFFRSHLHVLVIAALAVAGVGCKRNSETVEAIIDRNTEARGGRQAIEAVQSVAVDLQIVDPDFTVDGTYRAARPGKMRIDIKADGKHVYTEAFDGRRGWQWKGKGTETVEESPEATAALRHGVELPGNLYGLHELQQRGHRVALTGREEVDGVNYYLLQLTLDDGYVTTLYVDPHSWLMTRRRDVRPLHVDIDPTPTTIEQRMSDFRRVAGVMFSFANTETDLKTGKVLETTTARGITVNPTIDDTIFEKL
jgi:hypothetical protein